MAHTMAGAAVATHRTMREIPRPSPAKAKLTGREIALANRPHIGAALERAIGALGWDVKQAAIALGFVDDETGEVRHAQVSRWIAGTEPIQLDRIWGTALQGPFAIEQTRSATGCVVSTTVTYAAVTR